MPQPFQNAVITNAGASLLTRAQTGELSIEFTRIVIGDGIYTEIEKEVPALQSQSALKSERNSYPLSNIEVHNEHSVKVTALITNQDPTTQETLVSSGYFINEMGLFAKVKGGDNDTEVLYSIAVTAGETGDFMPPYNGYNPAQIIQEYYATVNNSAEVIIQSNNRAVALADDLQSGLQQLKEEIPAAVRVKGNAESAYRTGDVNITPENIGLGNVPNVSTNNQTPTFTQASDRANIGSGERLSVIFSKIMKWYADLKTVAFSGKYTDLTDKPTIPAAVRVKGNAESAYRTGDVNLTAANIGALAVNGNAVSATKATQDGNGNVIKDTYLPLSGGNITGNLRLKGSGNYGNTLNFGDGDYVHISEPTEDHLEIKGSYINFVTSATGTGRFTLNGKDILTIDKIYPVGSIYMSVSVTNPGTLFGGTWVRWGNGRVPVSLNESETEFNTVEKVGGSKFMQKHDHTTDSSGMGFLTYKYGSTIQRAQIQKNTSSGFYTHGANSTSDLGYSLKTSESGSGTSGNLQPYITCYMWKRTA